MWINEDLMKYELQHVAYVIEKGTEREREEKDGRTNERRWREEEEMNSNDVQSIKLK